MKENDKRLQENYRVKRSLQDALFSLMKEKKFSEIRVSDIIRVSGVAKASYYRNYESIEDIIYSWFDRMNEELKSQMTTQLDRSSKNIRDNLVVLYQYYLIHREQILLLCSNGFYELLQDNTDNFLMDAMGDMPSSSMERYNIYLLSGAICHVQIEWLKSKNPESPEKFADFNMQFINQNRNLFDYKRKG